MIAAIGDTSYNLLLLVHILTAIVAFAPVFVHPLLIAQTSEGEGRPFLLERMSQNGRRIYAPALLVSGILGFGLAGLSDDVFSMSQGWLIAAFVAWVAANGVLHALLVPSERRVAAGDRGAQRQLNAGTAAYSVLLVVLLFLMTFKPGL